MGVEAAAERAVEPILTRLDRDRQQRAHQAWRGRTQPHMLVRLFPSVRKALPRRAPRRRRAIQAANRNSGQFLA